MKKILFVGAYPPPFGGIAGHLYELLPELAKHGYEVVSLTPSKSNRVLKSGIMKNIFINLGKRVFYNFPSILTMFLSYSTYKLDMKWLNFFKIINFAQTVIEIAKKEKSNTVLIYGNYNGLIIPILRKALGNNVRIGLTIYGDFYIQSQMYQQIYNYLKIVFDNCDIILSSSQYCAESINKIIGYDFPVKIIYVGVDHETHSPAKTGERIRNALGIPSSATVFLFFGRMIKDMGFDFMIKITPRLLALQPNIYIILAGAAGDLSKHGKELSEKEERIKYCPNIPFEMKPYYYTACDILLAPTLEKRACMGVAIKEAMASGKPVIASNSGGIAEAIEHGVNGYLVPFVDGSLDEEIFIKYAANLSHNPALRIEMGRAGRDKALTLFTNELSVAKYLEILEDWA